MNKDKLIRVSLPQSLYDVLLDSAIQECRHPKEQARYILQTALLGHSKTADSTCLVSQANQVRSGFAGVVNS
jgi:hypothetical protein